MKKSLKKVLAVILSAIMLVSCSATSVFAAGGSSLISLFSSIKTVVDYGKSVKNLADQAKEIPKLPKRVLDVGISYIKLQKANGDLVTAVLKDGVTTITLPAKLLVSGVKQGVAVVSNTVSTGSSSVKFVIALVQFPPAVLGDAISFGKLGSAVTSGLVTNGVNDIKLVVNGLQVANSAKDLISPSLSDIIEGIRFPIRAGKAVVNVIEIARGDEDENAKPLVGTALITDHGEDLDTTEEEASQASEDEEAPAAATATTAAVVASTDGPMD